MRAAAAAAAVASGGQEAEVQSPPAMEVVTLASAAAAAAAAAVHSLRSAVLAAAAYPPPAPPAAPPATVSPTAIDAPPPSAPFYSRLPFTYSFPCSLYPYHPAVVVFRTQRYMPLASNNDGFPQKGWVTTWFCFVFVALSPRPLSLPLLARRGPRT